MTSCGVRPTHLPPRGHIGLLNRSYYGDIVVVRVRPEPVSPQQRASHRLSGASTMRNRRLRKHLDHNGAPGCEGLSCTFSKDEQRQRVGAAERSDEELDILLRPKSCGAQLLVQLSGTCTEGFLTGPHLYEGRRRVRRSPQRRHRLALFVAWILWVDR